MHRKNLILKHFSYAVFCLLVLLAMPGQARNRCEALFPALSAAQNPLEYQELHEESLKALFKNGTITEKVNNENNGTSGDSFFISFKDSDIKGFMKEVRYDSGEAEVFTSILSRRLKMNNYPLTVLRRIKGQYYTVSLKLSGYRMITDAEWARFNADDPVYGRKVFSNPSYIRDMILEHLIGDGDHNGSNTMYNPKTGQFAYVDGAHALEEASFSDFVLYGNVPFDRRIYLQDKIFFDELLTLKPADVFKGLGRKFPDKAYEIGYARQRFADLQRQIRSVRAGP